MLDRRTRLDQVQFLRGIAAFSVLFAHTPFIEKGHFGVDLFFIISGFIMMYVTDKSQKGFLTKRIVRIVPLYYLATLGLFGLTIIAPQLLNTATSDLSHLAKSLLFIPYYNGKTVEPLVRLGWTLNYEMFFYLIFFISFNISMRFRGAIASILLLVFAALSFIIETNNVLFNFYTNPIILEFAFGILIYHIYKHYQVELVDRFSQRQSIMFYVLGSSIFIGLFLVSVEYVSSPLRFVYFGLPCLLVFIAVLIAGHKVKTLASMIMLGNISYSLYLLHPYVLIAMDRLIHPLVKLTPVSLLFTLFAYAICIAMAYISWRLIEIPSQKYIMKNV